MYFQVFFSGKEGDGALHYRTIKEQYMDIFGGF